MIFKVFVPLSTPGFSILGGGLLGITSGVYSTAEVGAVFLGLLIVAVAGVFTIRANVAKIWREQAEGEKAKNTDLIGQLAEVVRTHAEEVAALRLEQAEQLAQLGRDAAEQRELKHKALTDLASAQQRTDLTPLLAAFGEMRRDLGILLDGHGVSSAAK